MLAEASKLLEDQRDDVSEADMLLHAERYCDPILHPQIIFTPTSSNLAALRSRLAPTRITLLSTLASIFPIELLSPPDLLYTILAVPLPIPLSANDPGPPLLLPGHKDVTEEGVATALGFVAQVVQLLAAYLGEVLVYPITCVGSRSLIKDGISAMVGPRMCARCDSISGVCQANLGMNTGSPCFPRPLTLIGLSTGCSYSIRTSRW